jgi:nitrous oxidase accessory protein
MLALSPLVLLQLGAAIAPVTIEVAATGSITSIGEAVRLAPAGARIRVRPGIYREPMIVVDKPLTIEGEGWPVLDGSGTHQLMSVIADDVTVRGLVLRNVGTSFTEDRAALKVVKSRGCTIADNRIENAFFGIYLANVVGCHITGNAISASGKTESTSGNGIHLWSSTGVTIDGNTIRGHRDGIYFEFVKASEIRGNTSEGNLRYGLHFMYSDDCRYAANTFRANGSGVAVMYTKRVTMLGNRFERNWGTASYGLLLKEVYDVHLEGNAFLRNTVGLVADGANRLHAEHNDFEANGWAVKLLASTDSGRFVANNFAGNTFDVATNSRRGSSDFAGNYWDAYRGYDLDRDGVGDVPFRPVRLFSMLAQANAPSLILLRSLMVDVLDAAERVLPTLTPETVVDRSPAMRRLQ